MSSRRNDLRSLLVVAALLGLTVTENIQDNEIKDENKQQATATNHDIDEKEGSASHFLPSFGPPQPPQHFNPFHFHLFGHSPITAYQYMYSHGYPYACTFPYNKFLAPFVPSQRDYFLDTRHTPSFYYPHQHLKYPYAEDYPQYLSQGHYPQHYPQNFAGYHHPHAGYYSPPSVPVNGHYPYHGVPIPAPLPPPPRHHPSIPHNNPHAFHSVVNYGHINLHHGDHFEPHDNGKDAPFLPPPHPHHHHPQSGFFPHFVPGQVLPGLGFSHEHGHKERLDEAIKPRLHQESEEKHKHEEAQKIVPK